MTTNKAIHEWLEYENGSRDEDIMKETSEVEDKKDNSWKPPPKTTY